MNLELTKVDWQFDDDDEDYLDDQDSNYDDFDCECGAWQWCTVTGKPIHVADCCCGSSEPW